MTQISLILKITIIVVYLISFLPTQALSQEISEQTYHERLYHSCKVWGHLKYYHSEIANKSINWDDQLIELASKAKDPSADNFNNYLFQMITAPGETEVPTQEAPFIADSLIINKDSSWIYDPFYPDSISAILDTVMQRFRPRMNQYAPSLMAATFMRDSLYRYTHGDYPPEELRILALFRYWNIVNCFSPHKDIMDQSWDTTLIEMIPKVVEAPDAMSYHLAIKQLTNKLSDTHAASFYSPTFNKFSGLHHPPFLESFVEGEMVITKVAAHIKDVKVGDIIKEVDGIDIHVLRVNLKKLKLMNQQIQFKVNLSFQKLRV